MEDEATVMAVKDEEDAMELAEDVAACDQNIAGWVDFAPMMDLLAEIKLMATSIMHPTPTCKVGAPITAIGCDSGG